MKKLLTAIVAAATVVLGFAPAADAAGPPVTATGTFTLSENITSMSQAGTNLIFTEVSPGTSAGDAGGSFVDADTFVVHADGSFEGAGREICASCTIGSRTGSYVAAFTFSGSGDSYTGHTTYLQGTDGLAGIHGGGTFAGTISGGGGTYTYQYLFTR